MAKKRYRQKTSTRTVYKKIGRRVRSGGKKSLPLLAAALYGAVRVDLSNFVAPVTSKIPLGGIADEVGMLAVNWAAKKYIPNKMVKDAAMAGMLIEAAQIGQTIRVGGLNLGGGSSQSSTFSATLG